MKCIEDFTGNTNRLDFRYALMASVRDQRKNIHDELQVEKNTIV